MIRAGAVIAGQFEVLELADAGGMGAVYRALDRHSGATVAVKMLLAEGGGEDPRFAHEAAVLAEMRHSAVVRYVAHGKTDAGEQYLAMEWLDGEDLGQRLVRAALTVAESVNLVRHAAAGLAALHDRGIVHRDLKPTNLFLPDLHLDRVKLLDFGLAHRMASGRQITRTGTAIGTPGYMAPEQARGERDVDQRADVFSLGCVLFECLIGKPAFVADHPMGILAKILFEEAPRLRDSRPEIPAALDDLVARMLDKDRARRPADGHAVVAEIDALGPLDDTQPAPAGAAPEAIGLHEQRLVGMVLAARLQSQVSSAAIDAAFLASSDAATLLVEVDLPSLEGLRAAAEPFGARIEMLADASIIAMLSGAGTATDLAARAARCALALRAVVPHVPMALATGRAEVSSRLPVGEVIDRGVRLLRAHTASFDADDPRARRGVRLDQLSAGLLDTRFEVTGDARGLEREGERARPDGVRRLLGKPSPCVGRERELRLLGEVFEQCVAEPVALAVLVTAPPGGGKSRLLHEWLAGIEAREGAPEVWVARGDSMRAGSPFSVAAQILQSAARLRDGEPAAVRRQKLRARLSRHLAPAGVALAAEFLGEICGAPLAAEDSARVRAAREDALVMGEQIRSAWESWLDAETQAGPVLLVIEDLHWGDLPSVKLLDAALRRLGERPLLVVAFARPEVWDAFPRLWADRATQEVRLGPLTRKAGARLVQEMLGAAVDPAVEARILDRAAGNAFFLEELIRAVAEGKGDSLPGTVLAMAQARLEGMEPRYRQVLRAASIFGRTFWRGGVLALLGAASRPHDLGSDLHDLILRELIEPQPSKFPGETEYVFRHALGREAAYAMLTDVDRALGHRLAAEWLEARGEGDALVLAEHFELGGASARAVQGYRRAAEQALDGSDLAAAWARAEKGVACGAEGEVLGKLRALQAEISIWRGEPAQADVLTTEALGLLPRGGSAWCKVAAGSLLVSIQLGQLGKVLALVEDLRTLEPEPEARGNYLQGLAVVSSLFVNLALYDMMDRFLLRMEQVGGAFASSDALVRGHLVFARLHIAGLVHGDYEKKLRYAEMASEAFEQGGDLRTLSYARTQIGYALLLLGQPARGLPFLDEGVERATRLGITYITLRARACRAELLLCQGHLDAAETEARETITGFAAGNVRTMEAMTRRLLARILLARGQLAEAETEVMKTLDAPMLPPYHSPESLAVRAQVRLAQGRTGEARKDAEQAMKQLAALVHLGLGEALVRLVHVEVLAAAGEHEAAKVAVGAAVERIREKAGRIEDGGLRASFLAGVPENARTLALAESWG